MTKLSGIYVIVDNSGSIMKMWSGYMSWEKEESARRALNYDIGKHIVEWFYAKPDYIPNVNMIYHRKDGVYVGNLGGAIVIFQERSEILPYYLEHLYKIEYIARLHV